MRTILMTGLLCACSATALPAQSVAGAGAHPAIDTLTLRAHTRFLADDALEGRGTGTRGERAAAAYIASALLHLGLAGLGADGGFLLPLPLLAAEVDPATRVTVRRAGGTASAFVHGRDFVLNTGGPGAFRDFTGGVVIAGPPASAAEALRGIDLSGRVIAVAGPLGAHALELVPAWQRAGVTGVVLLVPDPAQFDLYVRSRGDTRYMVDAEVDDPVWQPGLPVLIAGPALAAALLEDVHATNGTATDAHRALDAAITVHRRPVPAANVGAILHGSDPALRDEVVVYTAHFDHLGIGAPDAAGDSIYNGFSDDAAGVAMLLAIAEALAASPPARSVAFLFFTGEERGLLGSSHVAAHPPFPLQRIRALINLDAGAPPAPPVSWRIAGGTDTPLGPLAQQVARAHGWTAQLSAASPNSDYWPFLRRGVPALFLIPGDSWENTPPELRDRLRQRWDRYHQAGDHYHEDFPFRGLQRYADFALAVGLHVAQDAR